VPAFLVLRYDAIYYEIFERPQNLQVLCLSFVVPVLGVAGFGFKQLRTPRFVKAPCSCIWGRDYHIQR
jgi:hypothetical protein